MKILVLCSWPYLADGGSLGDQQVFRRIEQLAGRHRFVIAFLRWGDDAAAAAQEPAGAPDSLQLLALDADRLLSASTTRTGHVLERELGLLPRSAPLTAALAELIRRHQPDLVHVIGIQMLLHLPPCPVPIVTDFLDLSSLFVGREPASGLRARLRRVVRRRQLERIEGRALREVRVAMFVSPIEKDLVENWPGNAERVWIPTATDTELFRGGDGQEEEATVLLSGRMDYGPNIDAALFFCRDILPALRAAVPDVHVLIAGRDPAAELRALTGPGITVTGTVADMRPYWNRATVTVVPLRWGTGTRNKIVEAWAMGKAVVTTTLGAEGLLGEDGEHFVVADSAAEFAARVAELLGDEAGRRRLGQAGRALALRTYSMKAAAEQLDRVYRRAAGGAA